MVDVPRSIVDRAIEDRIRQEMIENRPPPSLGAGMTRAFVGEGLGMGWGDEAEAWIRSKLGQGDYSSIQKDLSKEYGRFSERYPKTSGISEFVGGALPAVAAAALSPATGGATAPVAAAQGARVAGALGRLAANPYARSAATSSLQGAISGAGTASSEDIAAGTAGGAALGAAVGAAAPVAVRTAKSGLDWVRERLLPTDKFVRDRALGKILAASESDGIKPGDILARVQEDQAMGVPGMFGTSTPSLVRLADVAANRAGKAASGTRSAFEELKEGSRERVMDQVRKGISNKNYFREEADAVSKLRADAKTAYDEAYAFGSVMDPRINRVLENPKFASFFERAKQIADNEATAAELRGDNPAMYRLQEIYKVKTDKDGKVIGFELTSVPDVRTLDYIKRGIDSVIDTGFEGKGLSKPEANSLKELRKAFISAVDEATIDPKTGKSAYSEARKQFAGDMEVIDAMRIGKADFNSLSNEEINMLMKDMSAAEKEAFRTGAVSNVYNMIMNPSNDINAAKRLVGSPEMRAKFEQLFDGSQAKLDLFMAAVQREKEMFQYAQRVLGGSQTAERLAMRESFEEGSNLGEMVGQALNQGGARNALVSIAARALSKTKMTDDVAEEVSRRLTSRDPMEVAAAVRELEEFAEGRIPKARSLTKIESGIGGGTTVALPSAPQSDKPLIEGDIEKSLKDTVKIEGPDIDADLSARSKR